MIIVATKIINIALLNRSLVLTSIQAVIEANTIRIVIDTVVTRKELEKDFEGVIDILICKIATAIVERHGKQRLLNVHLFDSTTSQDPQKDTAVFSVRNINGLRDFDTPFVSRASI